MNSTKEIRRNESLCEKSMLLVANIIKLSTSLSFTKMGPGPGPTPSSPAARRPAADELPPGSKRLQEPRSRSKPMYVTEPKLSSFVIHERDVDEENVDGWASKYIEKVHKKNRKDLEEPTMKKKKKKPYSQVANRRVATLLN